VYGKRHTLSTTRIIFFAAACCVSALRVFPQAPAKLHLRIGLVTPANPRGLASSIAAGVRLGAAESSQTAALFGDDVQLFEENGAGETATTAAQRLLFTRKVQILIGASSADAETLSRFAEAHHVLFFNVSSRAETLRGACRRFTFHIEGADAMYANAAKVPLLGAAQHTQPNRQSTDSVLLWAPRLERFGASQINDRYRDKYHEGMNGSAWAGWAAVKIAADAALRAQSAAPAKLLAYLEAPSTEFDGHKGWPLTFRLADHQLRQPLYIVVTSTTAGRRVQSVRDVPELRAARDASESSGPTTRASDRALDALMGGTVRACPWTRK
jgi:ABC-type branched-subunit amino acid transport system substrate-binding protein